MKFVVIIILLLIFGPMIDDKLGTTVTSGGIAIVVSILITIGAFAINPILGIIVGYFLLKGLSK